MSSHPTLPAVFAGLVAAFVGFAGAFTVVVQGLVATGASPAEAARVAQPEVHKPGPERTRSR